MLNIIDARQIQKLLTTPTEQPTVAPSSDHTDGSWDITDAYIGELVFNTADEKVWMMGDTGPIELLTTVGTASGIFGSGTTNRVAKFSSSTDIEDSNIQSTTGQVRIVETGSALTPALSLDEDEMGFYQWNAEHWAFTVNNQQINRFGNDGIFHLRHTATTGISQHMLTVTVNTTLTPNMQFIIGDVTSSSNVNLSLPSVPIAGQTYTILRVGSGSGNLLITSTPVGSIMEPASSNVVNQIQIPDSAPNTTVTIVYASGINKWVTTATTGGFVTYTTTI